MRANERAAAATGINVARVKITAYGISSFIAGTAGWMYAYNFGSVSPARFGFLIALGFVAFAYIGGITMVSGAIVGGLIATEGLVPHFFQTILGISGNWVLLFGGLLLIVTLIQNPDGVAGTTYRKRQAAKRAKAALAASDGRRPELAPDADPGLSGRGGAMTSVLSARGISVSFGGVHAVVDVDLDVEPGQLVGLIGPNGAGKTTLHRRRHRVRAAPRNGHARRRPTSPGSKPHVRARRGLARTWQAIELFDDLTVRENLTGRGPSPDDAWTTLKELLRPTGRPRPSAVDEALEVFSLGDLAEATPTELTQGQRKLVAVARALAARPKLLLPRRAGRRTRRARVGRVRPPPARDRRPRASPILLVDHDMGLVLGICDRVVVLEFGRVIARGTPGEVREDPQRRRRLPRRR